jgi:hypothetical protein
MKGLVAAFAALLVLTAAPAAHASTVKCRTGYFAPGLDRESPRASRLRAIDLPRLTDGYAVRCLVAESVAADVQLAFHRDHRLPKSVRTFGARWNGGTWQVAASGKHVTATHGHRRVKFDLDI